MRLHACGIWASVCSRLLSLSTACDMEPLQQESFANDAVVTSLGQSKEAVGASGGVDKFSSQPSIDTYLWLLQSCIDFKALSEGKQMHSHLVQNDIIPNASLENHLVEMYARCECMDEACHTFHKIVDCNVVSWNVIISGFSQQRNAEKAFDYFSYMLKEGFKPNQVTFLNILKLCAISQNFTHGTQVHAYILKTEHYSDVYVGNGLIDMYSYCGSIEDALKVFFGMSKRGLVSWNMLICGCAKGGRYREALTLFWNLIRQDERPNLITFLGAIKACAGLGCLESGKKIHECLLKYRMESVCYVGSALIDMYAKCGSPQLARQVFDKIPERNVVVWTSMIAAFVKHEQHEEALKTFWQMERDGVCPNEVTFVTILKACCSAPALRSGKQIHALIRRSGCESDVVLQSSLVDMYSKCGSIEDALCVCDQMLVQEGVLWNGMIAGLVMYGHLREALTLFLEMEQRGVKTNEVTFVSVVKACANLNLLDLGKQVHLKYIETRADQNRILNNTLVDMYHKCGDIDEAFKVFSDLVERDVISWNIVMAGHAIRDNMEEVLVLYRQMQQEAVEPDGVSFLSMLLACASLGALELGEQFHACVIGGCYELAIPVSNTLIDMYAKCGSIEKAIRVFHIMATRTSVSWNIVITGCAQHGYGKKALQLFEQMQQEEVRLDDVTLVAIVTACSHAGLLADGCYYFALMTREYGITPSEEAVASMVDLLGRAGHLKAAKICMEETGCTVFAVVWKSLLGACRIHGDWKLAKLAADSALALEPKDSGAFVLWSNICAENADL